ncbi:MAG: RsmF rRNA methyltransferase first C-terminal domain-containing protein [Lachnospiraceae bacterium]|nr:RsmF rRNA methyltransferase first C-terminal domain-containing protein [Lachnospiraceae bacterium]
MDKLFDLSNEFLEDMKALLKDEYEDFYNSYNEKSAYGIKLNSMMLENENASKKNENNAEKNPEIKEILPYKLERVPWSLDGFYVSKDEEPGKSVYHEMGALYVQEPSAMLPGTLLKVKPGDKVLDLCAAPGGKSTSIAMNLKGEGLLISNEPMRERSKILSQNIERMGFSNVIVTNEFPDKLTDKFYEYFDKIMVDAPCSGSGMFRKDSDAIKEWSRENVIKCEERQKEILKEAFLMLKPGGRLCYSTCSFSKEEDEDMVQWILSSFDDIEGVNVFPDLEREGFSKEDLSNLSKGISDDEEVKNSSVRIWPHKTKGEGHFAAVFKKCGEEKSLSVAENLEEKAFNSKEKYEEKKSKNKRKNLGKNNKKNNGKNVSDNEIIIAEIKQAFYAEKAPVKEVIDRVLEGDYIRFSDNVYLLPKGIKKETLDSLRVVRPGLHIGTFKKNRFELSHSFIRAFYKYADNVYEASDREAKDFLKGLTLNVSDDNKLKKGPCVVLYKGLSLGLSKNNNGTLKNHYPKGLRVHFDYNV